MEILSIVSIAAVIIAPIVSVFIGQMLQKRASIRKDKMEIFKTLMMSRNGWNYESYRAFNILDIVFSDDAKVREAWRKYYDKLCIEKPTESEIIKIQEAQYDLLETMAVSLGYKDKITWKTIQKPYVPQGMIEAEQNQRRFQEHQSELMEIAVNHFKTQNQTNGEINTD